MTEAEFVAARAVQLMEERKREAYKIISRGESIPGRSWGMSFRDDRTQAQREWDAGRRSLFGAFMGS